MDRRWDVAAHQRAAPGPALRAACSAPDPMPEPPNVLASSSARWRSPAQRECHRPVNPPPCGAAARRDQPHHQLARGDLLGAEGDDRVVPLRRHVVVVAVEAALGDAELAGEGVQLVVRRVAGQVRPQPAAAGHGGRVDHDHPARRHEPRRPRRRAAAATSGRSRRRRRPCRLPPGRTCGPTWNGATPGPHQPRHVLGRAARRRASAARRSAGSDSAVASRSSYPTAMPARRPGGPDVRPARAGRAAGARTGAGRGWRRRPGGRSTARRAARSARCVQISTSTSRSASRKPKATPVAPQREVVLGQPDQPGQLAAGRGPGVVEPQQHEHRQRRSRGRPPRRRVGSGDRAPALGRRRPRAAGRRRPRAAPGTSRGSATTHLEQRPRHATHGLTVGAWQGQGLCEAESDGWTHRCLFGPGRGSSPTSQARRPRDRRGRLGPRGRDRRRARGGPSSGPRASMYVAGLVAQDVQDALFETAGRWPLCLSCGGPGALALHPARPRRARPGVGVRGVGRRGRAALGRALSAVRVLRLLAELDPAA